MEILKRLEVNFAFWVVPQNVLRNDDGADFGEFLSDEEDRALNVERREQMLSTMTFDSSVPGNHSYLGETSTANLAPVGLLREGDMLQNVPLVSLDNIILFPGQTLPLTVTRPAQVGLSKVN